MLALKRVILGTGEGELDEKVYRGSVRLDLVLERRAETKRDELEEAKLRVADEGLEGRNRLVDSPVGENESVKRRAGRGSREEENSLETDQTESRAHDKAAEEVGEGEERVVARRLARLGHGILGELQDGRQLR